MANASIEEFVCRYFSLQQTALVDNMIYEDKHSDMLNSFHNLHVYTVKLSTGQFTGSHRQLMAKKAEIQEQLQKRKSAALNKDIELLETTYGTVRTVYEWYAVPYWIARHMIDSEEVVLSWRDCHWWGRCIVRTPISSDTSVQELYDSIWNTKLKTIPLI
jgi:hypothetical protein